MSIVILYIFFCFSGAISDRFLHICRFRDTGMTNSYTLVSRRKTGHSALIYINNTPRTKKTRRFPAVFGKKAICPSLYRKVWQIDECISEFLHKYAKNAKNLQKVALFFFVCLFLFFPYSKKGTFRFPAENRNEGIIASRPSFWLLSDKIIFYRDTKEKRKNAPSCGKDTV